MGRQEVVKDAEEYLLLPAQPWLPEKQKRLCGIGAGSNVGASVSLQQRGEKKQLLSANSRLTSHQCLQ